jgi:hypothetical protein
LYCFLDKPGRREGGINHGSEEKSESENQQKEKEIVAKKHY